MTYLYVTMLNIGALEMSKIEIIELTPATSLMLQVFSKLWTICTEVLENFGLVSSRRH